MKYQPFSMSRIGASHIKGGLPCQDASCAGEWGAYAYAIVADGHGSRRHFRSDRGSALACRVAEEKIPAFLGGEYAEEDGPDARLSALKADICSAWAEAVREDYQRNPWTEAELEEARSRLSPEQFARLEDGTDAPVAYGSTLCAVFTCPGGWAAIQLGDGCFTHIGTDGVYDWPMPESLVNEGNKTASLCMRQPMRDFRHCYGDDNPAGLLVYTDGIEKVFSPQGKEIISLLHWIWRNEFAEDSGRKGNLERTLDMLTRRSPIGDDLSVAGLVNPEAADAEPVPGRSTQLQELERLQARRTELKSTIAYNKRRLRQAEQDDGCSDEATEQLRNTLLRNENAVFRLQTQIAALRAALSLEPEDESEPEQVPEPEDEPMPEPQDEPMPEDEANAEADTLIWPEDEDRNAPEQPKAQPRNQKNPRSLIERYEGITD